MPAATSQEDIIISLTDIRNQFGSHVLHEALTLDIRKGEVLGIVGGSGTGKSVLLRTIVGLNQKTAGTISILGQDVDRLRLDELNRLRQRMGVLFQDGALFSSLTVSQNIEAVLKEHTRLPISFLKEIAALKISLAGLPADAGGKYPSELSGGMRKRAGLARALALDPDIVFLDEPTAGLDPIGAAQFDQLISDLQTALGLTVVMITHDLDSLHAICNRIGVLLNKRIKVGTIAELTKEPDPWIKEYFDGPRGRAATRSHASQSQKATSSQS
ncbi:ABC transporter ATP-binding protein [Kiloniella laminariae]|uniref:ABC transporter ATP-binding protein n=1 Tax=Kiloniella laminariae TaxID=454162 RepID=A0ABT4LDM1_9PROT|nr:ABC transporter ATP-binding protein [Kiloniella laminariae]MCZ4279208.1 ABC transporter ATP-binding protein [Kiloniella laminariae]